MWTHELANKLLAQPNVPVFNYVQEAEEFGETSTVKFYDILDKLPYAKSDQPVMPATGLVLIEGWCM